ncbi:lipid-A-disaccharide synthase [Syntrophotalea acetylenivorans]|uniref:Lipid-A-disaccharide synthase n=1 Tax=Syntrophotalea acetylenivorans TaxID=1842532 RepID=A0A1L3GSN9_9BACT|nr:lipid-A-disaccharide synthase [Syntrophotalea acetylenivorans]
MQRRVLVVAGEASGDLHGANMIRAAKDIDPNLCFFGVGGPRMKQAGCDILLPAEELEVMGLVDVVGHLPVLWRAFKSLKKILNSPERPDVLVLIDFQEFNLLLARQARKAGVPVVFYVGPTVWAWRRGRVKRYARAVDRLAVIFPFEPAYYADEDIEVEYVGHPLLDEARATRQRDDYLQELGLDSSRPVVGIFPGSRNSELKYNLPTMLEAAERVALQLPGVQFLLPVAPSFDLEAMRQRIESCMLPILLVRGSIYDVANACDAVLTVSGTVTLQIALVGTPMAILYKTASLNYAIAKRVVNLPHIGLPNIVAGREVVREFIQDQATAETVAEELIKILTDAQYQESLQQGLGQVRQCMGDPGCSQRVAQMVSELSRSHLA